jgi:hypothetical protein
MTIVFVFVFSFSFFFFLTMEFVKREVHLNLRNEFVKMKNSMLFAHSSHPKIPHTHRPLTYLTYHHKIKYKDLFIYLRTHNGIRCDPQHLNNNWSHTMSDPNQTKRVFDSKFT